MAGPLYAGCPEHAAMWAKVLPSRPHEEQIFRDAQIPQFCWTDRKKISTDGRDEKTSIKSKSELSSGDFAMIRGAMVNQPLGEGAPSSSAAGSAGGPSGLGSPEEKSSVHELNDEEKAKQLKRAQLEAKKKAKEAKQAEEDAKDPEGKVWRESKEKFDKALKDAKGFALAASSALAEVPTVCKEVVAKGYPVALKDWLTKSAVEQRKIVDEFLLQVYTPNKTKLGEMTRDNTSSASIDALTDKIAKATKEKKDGDGANSPSSISWPFSSPPPT
eukprot:5165529-Pyramimonas_sp.AAC.1